MRKGHASKDLGTQLEIAQKKIFGKEKLKECDLRRPLTAFNATSAASAKLNNCRNGKRASTVKTKGFPIRLSLPKIVLFSVMLQMIRQNMIR